VAVLLVGGNQSTRRKRPTCHKSFTNFITYSCIEYTSINPIEVTDPQLLQRNMAKISLTRYLEYCEPYKENMAKLSLARNFQVSGIKCDKAI
jgi:hypothetical protein